MTDCYTLKLVQPTKEYLEELRLREEMVKRILEAQKTTIMAGIYELGAKFKARIINWNSMNHFVFKTDILTPDQINLMKTVRNIKYKNGSHMHLARPHTSDLGQIKLFYDRKFSSICRCKIEDLYTTNHSGRLKLQATIMLIDRGTRLHYVYFDLLYDTPQMLSYFTDIEPETKFGRIYLGEPVPKDYLDKSMDQCFNEKLRDTYKRQFIIKILGFEDDIYHVDLIDDEDKSFIDILRQKFDRKIGELEHDNLKTKILKNGYVRSELDVVRQMRPSLCNSKKLNGSITRNGFHNHSSSEPRKKRYNGVVDYYKEKFMAINDKDNSKSFLQKRFFPVKVICWDDPETFSIVPDDRDYYTNHDAFTKNLATICKFSNNRKQVEEVERGRLFSMGQKCLFTNEYDCKLGKWLRGVIIEVPRTTKNGNLSTIDETRDKNGLDSTNSPREIDTEKYVYKVRSIDYGFQCVRSPSFLKHVQDDKEFLRMGPWSLKCRLFGIHPVNYETETSSGYPSFCLETIDCWMRTKISDNTKFSQLSVLFRTNILDLPDTWQSDESKVDITLFHRHEPPYRIEESMMPRRRKSRFDCLNWFLVERGLVTDHIPELKVSSNVELDQHIVNLLVPHDRI